MTRSTPLVLLSGALQSSGCAADAPANDADEVAAPSVREVDEPERRLAVSYDGGVLVLRATDGEVLADVEVPGCVRLNPAGDDRHVMVSGEGCFTALDAGSWTADHGDHGHSWAGDPELTDVEAEASEPGIAAAGRSRHRLQLPSARPHRGRRRPGARDRRRAARG